MSYLKTIFLYWWYRFIRKSPADMEMVSYWKHKESVAAKVTYGKDGALIMKMEEEKYPLPGFPRGYLLFGKLSKLKHEIKNQIFNDSWWALERGESEADVIKRIKGEVFDRIFNLAEDTKYDRIPVEIMVAPIREIHRAWTAVSHSERSLKLRDILCFILAEDDSYKHRVQDLAEWFNPNVWWKKVFRLLSGKTYLEGIQWDFEKALTMVEHCEVIGDMKERIRLLRRILLVALRDPVIGRCFERFCKEMDWKKVYLTKGDRFHFRGKYYKCDYRLFDY